MSNIHCAAKGASQDFPGTGLPLRLLAGRSGVFLMKEIVMTEMLKQFMQDEEGVTAIEYGLIAALIAVMIIAGSTIVGVELDRIFRFIGTTLTNAA